MYDDRADLTTPLGKTAPASAVLDARPALWTIALFYAAYVGAGTFAEGLAVIPGIAVIFWPPVGILIATLLLNERASWPWWIAAGCAAELTANSFLWQNPFPFSFIYYCGNALEALTAAYLISRFAPKPFRFETIEQVLSFIVLAAGIAPTVSATIISSVEAFRGRHPFLTAWPLVWVGDATGLLVSAPLTFVLVQAWRERNKIPPLRLLKGGTALFLLLSIAVLALTGPLPTVYLTLPVLLWIATRFQLKGTAVALALLTLVTGSLTVAGLGQFTLPSAGAEFNLVRFHVFLAVSAISALFVAALSHQRLKALDDLEAANHDLERHVAERTGALIESEQRYRAVIETQSEMISRFRLDGTIVFVNDAYARAMGSTVEELVGANFWDFIPENDRAEVSELMANLTREHPEVRIENRFESAKGLLWTLWTNRALVFDENGRALEAQSTGIDITERKLAEEALRDSEARLRGTLESITDGFFSINSEWRFTYFNAEAERLCGLRREDVLGRNWSDVFPQAVGTELEGELIRCMRDRVVVDIENFYQPWQRWFSVKAFPTGDGGLTQYFRDITESKHAEQARRDSEERLAHELAGMKRLHELSIRLSEKVTLEEVMGEVMSAAGELLGAERCTAQLLERIDGSEVLKLAAVSGFDQDFADRFHIVTADGFTTCAAALGQRERVIVEDLESNPAYAELAEITAPMGIRSVMSTPLLAGDGALLGLFSTYWARPHTPGEHDLRLLDLYVQQAARQVERRSADRALRESEEKYRTLFNSIDEGFCVLEMILDENGKPSDYRFVQANPAFSRHTGLPEDAIGKTALQLIPDLEAFWIETYGKVALTGEPVRFENRSEPMGRWFNVHASRVGDESSRLVALVFENITERKNAEEKLRESEGRFRNMADHAPVMVWVTDENGSCTYLSESWYNFTGQTPETGLGMRWLDALHPDDQRSSADIFMAASARRETFTLEYRLRGKDGEYRWAIDSAQPRFSGDGVFLGYIGSVTDIHERKAAEQALSESEIRYRLALEAGETGTWTMPMDGRRGWADEKTLELFDIPKEEWNGDMASIHARRFREDLEANSHSIKDAEGRTTWRSEFRVRHRDGSIRWIAGVARIEFGANGAPLLMRGIYFDITERKRAEEELRRHQEILEETVRERTRELAEAIDELQYENRQRRIVEEERQMLLARLVAAQEEERRRIARDLHDQLGQQLTALNMKLDLAARAAGSGDGKEHLRDARAMLRRIDDDVDALAWQLRPAILDDDGFLPALRRYVEDWSERCRVPADFWADDIFESSGILSAEAETNIYRITQEALNNIAKYADANRVEVLLNRRGESVVLLIQDNGVGFDVGELDARDRKTMGLIGMRERAGLVGGSFEIESSLGEGTTIYVKVPVAPASVDEAGLMQIASS